MKSSNDNESRKTSDSSHKRLQYNYGTFFRKKRKEKGITADRAAEALGCSSRTLRRLEANYDVAFKFSTFIKMSDFYGFSVSIPGNERRCFAQNAEIAINDSEAQMKIISAIDKMPYSDFIIISEMADLLADKENGKSAGSDDKIAAIQNITKLNHTQLLLLQNIMDFLKDNPECKGGEKKS